MKKKPKSSGICWHQVPTEVGRTLKLKIARLVESHEAVRPFKSISPLSEDEFIPCSNFSLNRIESRIYGLGNPSRVRAVMLLWICGYGGGWGNVFTFNTGTQSLNPLSSHFRELAARIIPLEKRLGESGGFQGIDPASSRCSEYGSQQGHPRAQNVQSVSKWPTRVLDLVKYSFRVEG